MTTDTRSDDRPVGGRRFARVGRVLPVALVQLVGTVVATRLATGAGPGGVDGGPPWTQRLGDGVEPVFLGPLAWVLLVSGIVVLPFRWRWPVVVLALTLGTTIGYALVVSPRGPFVAALTMALANAWFRGHRVPVYVAAAVAQVVLPSADTLTGRAPFPTVTTTTLCLAWLTVTIAVTELVRVRLVRAADARRARLAAEQQRAGAERVRIARELHDSVAHSMSLINLQAGVALHLGAELPEQTRESLLSIRDSSKQALVELRTILGVLRAVDAPSGTSDRAPVAGLDRVPDLVDRARAAGVDVTLHLDGPVDGVAGVVSRNAFRIVQESVTNVMKHAADHRATVVVDVGAEIVDITVTDVPRVSTVTGAPRAAEAHRGHRASSRPARVVGPDTEAAWSTRSSGSSQGNGLVGMHERAAAAGGTLAVGPTPDGGWSVRARLPIGEPARPTIGEQETDG
ncbi:histidine kinase [Curtobacterium sp. MCSS17_015]|uniref:sensor histidine kinase n=1 Tax=Curtobacterium sp. MCSS17_015 TaxID=2175666 RepID=UPI000DA7848A|nr:histidine kinase [Curtobacterium sp. MCSS17_015]WIB27190.1 histidine kinase [Curtobacterium sp. MCSS17_015]